MIVAGIDWSTKAIHVAILKDGEPVQITRRKIPSVRMEHKLPGLWSGHSLYSKHGSDTLFQADHGAHWSSDPDFHVAIEGLVTRLDTYGYMSAIYWTLRALTPQAIVLTSQQWKKAIMLYGNAKKEEVKERVLEIYPELPKNLEFDCYDAVGIARAAWKGLLT